MVHGKVCQSKEETSLASMKIVPGHCKSRNTEVRQSFEPENQKLQLQLALGTISS